MIQFILNNEDITTDLPPGLLLLDFIRYHKHLTGTKIGCREGDCGACTVLIGELNDGKISYRSATSCLTPLGNIHNKHIISIEGINLEGLNPIQQFMSDEGATQCGFCTPGFVVSMAGFCLDKHEPNYTNALAAIDGNICRCTGYKSIERALLRLVALMEERHDETSVDFVTQRNILPEYLTTIESRLKKLNTDIETRTSNANKQLIGGGTDLYVQQHDAMVYANCRFLSTENALKGISINGNNCNIGAATTVTELIQSAIIQKYIPQIRHFGKLVSSTPIRNIATLGGNFVNASPIGDFSVFFLALNASIVLKNNEQSRQLKLKDFYLGYKQIDKAPNEYISEVTFELPDKETFFHFEKVSKRTHLDIASVNTAICLKLTDRHIREAHLSAGGVAPVPKYLSKASHYLTGKAIDEDLVMDVIDIVQTEISPISDARGTDAYKRLLLSQLIKAHFITLFPSLEIELSGA